MKKLQTKNQQLQELYFIVIKQQKQKQFAYSFLPHPIIIEAICHYIQYQYNKTQLIASHTVSSILSIKNVMGIDAIFYVLWSKQFSSRKKRTIL